MILIKLVFSNARGLSADIVSPTLEHCQHGFFSLHYVGWLERKRS